METTIHNGVYKGGIRNRRIRALGRLEAQLLKLKDALVKHILWVKDLSESENRSYQRLRTIDKEKQIERIEKEISILKTKI